jgi:hypothetical protein
VATPSLGRGTAAMSSRGPPRMGATILPPLLGGFVADIAVRSLVPVPVDDDEATFAIVTGGRDGEISIHSPDRGLKLDGASAIRSPVQRPPRPSTFPRIKYALGRLK